MKILLQGMLLEEAKTEVLDLPQKNLTSRIVIHTIANQFPRVKDHIVRADGTPRLSTRITVNGKPPSDLDAPLQDGDIVTITGNAPCDG